MRQKVFIRRQIGNSLRQIRPILYGENLQAWLVAYRNSERSMWAITRTLRSENMIRRDRPWRVSAQESMEESYGLVSRDYRR